MNNWTRTKGSVSSNSYKAIHLWLVRTFKHPKECAKCGELGRMTGHQWSIEWALKENCEYARVKDNFSPLCKTCHRQQDFKLEWIYKGWDTRRE